MTAGWVAPSVRGRSLLLRTVGVGGARTLAASASWPAARDALATTAYGGQLPPDADRAAARRAAAAATTWQLRVLAGWLPPTATGLARLAAAPLEIANIEHHLGHLEGSQPSVPLPLGALAVAWPRVVVATSGAQVSDALARSVWGDPGGSDRVSIALGLRIAWARRVIHALPRARDWAHGAIAVLIAREVFSFERVINEITSRELDRLIGSRWRAATSLADLADSVPATGRWAVTGLAVPDDLWRAELRVVNRVASDAHLLEASGRYGRDTVMGVMALLLVDLWRVSAAVEASGRGPAALEVFDAMAP